MQKPSLTKRISHPKKNIDNIISVCILIFTFLWFIPFINKGIDYTDASYNLVIFNNHAANTGSSSIGMFLTNVIGGLIASVFTSHQYLVFRILYWLIYIGISVMLYFAFKEVIPKSILSASVLIGFFLIKHGTTFFAYNALTAFFLALLLLLLVKTFQKESSLLVFLSGFVIGLSIFVRLPNILQVGFIVPVIWYFGFILGNKKAAVLKSLFFAAGIAVGGGIIFAVYLLKYNMSSMVASASNYTNMATNTSSSHGLSTMISKFVVQATAAIYVFVKTILPFLVVTAILVFATLLIISRIKKQPLRQIKPTKRFYIITACIIAIFSVVFAIIYLNKRTDYKVYLYILGLSNLLLGILCTIAFRKKSPLVSISALLCACVSVVLSFGSDNVMNTFFTLFAPIVIGFALCMYHIIKSGLFNNDTNRKKCANSVIRIFALIFSVIIITVSCSVFVSQLLPFTYGPYLNGNGNITELTEPINEDIASLRGMKTTPERAQQIEEFYSVMKNEKLHDKELAVFGHFPIAFMLCENKNYFNATWIDLNAVSTSTLTNTYEAKKDEGNLPVIVVSYIHMNDTGEKTITQADKEELLNRIIEENNYSVFHESDNFTIYTH